MLKALEPVSELGLELPQPGPDPSSATPGGEGTRVCVCRCVSVCGVGVSLIVSTPESGERHPTEEQREGLGLPRPRERVRGELRGFSMADLCLSHPPLSASFRPEPQPHRGQDLGTFYKNLGINPSQSLTRISRFPTTLPYPSLELQLDKEFFVTSCPTLWCWVAERC